MPCNILAESRVWIENTLASVHWVRSFSTTAATFGLVALAEIGDKSQLVCISLATRHPHLPVFIGALTAFAILNFMAVLFGASVKLWIPEQMLAGILAVLFGGFGISYLLAGQEENQQTEEPVRSGHHIVTSTFLMIFLAEFGDKTQISVAGLASDQAATPVWLGSTLALALTSALGIWMGAKLIKNINPQILHRLAGILFLVFGGFALVKALPTEWLEAIKALLNEDLFIRHS